MTSHDPGSGVQPEGTSLPPPRPFGDANTLTLPRRRRAAAGQGGVIGFTHAACTEDAQHVRRAAIMRADAAPLTITF